MKTPFRIQQSAHDYTQPSASSQLHHVAETAPDECKPLSHGIMKRESQTLLSGPLNLGLETGKETKWVRGQAGKRVERDGESPGQSKSPNHGRRVRVLSRALQPILHALRSKDQQSLSCSHGCTNTAASFTDTSWLSPSSLPFAVNAFHKITSDLQTD